MRNEKYSKEKSLCKAKFISKFAEESTYHRANEIVTVLDKTVYPNEVRYTVEFADGMVCENIYPAELDFDYEE